MSNRGKGKPLKQQVKKANKTQPKPWESFLQLGAAQIESAIGGEDLSARVKRRVLQFRAAFADPAYGLCKGASSKGLFLTLEYNEGFTPRAGSDARKKRAAIVFEKCRALAVCLATCSLACAETIK